MCELCKAEKLTKWYYEDDIIWIADCLICRIPMVVLRKHKNTLSKDEEEHINLKVKELFGENFQFRKEQRRIKDHLHWHILL